MCVLFVGICFELHKKTCAIKQIISILVSATTISHPVFD